MDTHSTQGITVIFGINILLIYFLGTAHVQIICRISVT